MTQSVMNLERVVSGMQEPMKRFIDRVQTLGGANCLAVIGVGAIATSGFDPARHTARSVLVLETIELAMLRELAQDGIKLGKAKIAAPLIMTPVYIAGSLDTFPLEFLEIQQCHVCFVGTDYFADVSFEERHVRLQCERELKSILIGMRQGLLAAAGREKLFGGMEGDIAERLIRTLRGLLWLHGQYDYLSAVEIVGRIERETDRSLPGIRAALQENRRHDWNDFTQLYDEIDGLKTVADHW